jgi:uncharacterized membrane protein
VVGGAPVELMVTTLDAKVEADDALNRLIELNRSGAIELISARVLAKDEKGKIQVRDAPDLLKAEAPLVGALAGSTLGLFAGIAGVLAGAMAGAVLGLAVGQAANVGASNRHLEELAEELTPGTSALLALVEEEAVETVVRELYSLVSGVRRFVLETEGTQPVDHGG